MKELNFMAYNAKKQVILFEKISYVLGVVNFDVGDHVITSIYYQKWGCGEISGYVFLANSQLAFVYTHLVLACKFVMLPAHHKVKGDSPVY
jgi:hypothetical protein